MTMSASPSPVVSMLTSVVLPTTVCHTPYLAPAVPFQPSECPMALASQRRSILSRSAAFELSAADVNTLMVSEVFDEKLRLALAFESATAR